LVADDELVAANGGIWTAAVLSQIALAPVAAALAAGLGFGVAFGLNAGSFALSAVVLRGLPEPARASGRASWRWRTAVRDGASHLVHDRLLRSLAAAQLLAALSAGATSALLVVLAKEGFRASTGQFGLLVGGIGVGAAAGPVLLRRLVRQPKRPAVVFGAFALRGSVDIVLASARSVGAALPIMAAYGLGTSAGSVTFNSLVQSVVPEALRGRVFAAFDLLWQLGRLASLAAGGLIADALGVRAVYYLGGVLLLLAALVGAPAMRRPDSSQVGAGDLGPTRGGTA
jgi:predicted MFS family arabinose efflux permease